AARQSSTIVERRRRGVEVRGIRYRGLTNEHNSLPDLAGSRVGSTLFKFRSSSSNTHPETEMKASRIILSAIFASVIASSVVRPPPVGAQGVITCGETLTGAISPSGDSDTWTITANAGDAIVVRVGAITQAGGFAFRLRLFSPSASLLFTAGGSAATEAA